MKKAISVFLLAVMLMSPCAFAEEDAEISVPIEEEKAEDTAVEEVVEVPKISVALLINGEDIGKDAEIKNGAYYFPARVCFEKLGAYVFYRARDRQIYTISRDGDVIQHIVGSREVRINGVVKCFKNPSFMENYTTYVPVEMLTAIFKTSPASYETSRICIQKKFEDTENTKLIPDVLAFSRATNFYPEKFKRYLDYHIKKPASTMQDVIFTVNLGLDYPFYENVTTIANPYDPLVLVNKYNQLPYGFRQNNLVKMESKYTTGSGMMTAPAYEMFKKMADAARKEGHSIRAVSTYRTEDYQRRLYNNNLYATGRVNADNYSARAGFSEHQTGLAVDINSTGVSFEKTAVYKWLQNHAHEYGYILRYPKNKQWITGYAYEPWHYRYVGIEAATIIHNEDTTYEQYYVKYVAKNEFK